MAEKARSNAVPTRVQYQGITYTICRKCHEVIGSGKNEATLLAVEAFHRCFVVDEELDYDHDRRVYEESSKR